MKTRIALVIVAILAVGLGIGLIKSNQDAEKDHTALVSQVNDFSNNWGKTSFQLEEEKGRSMELAKTITNKNNDIVTLSNSLADAKETISQREATLKAAQEDLLKRQAQIDELNTATNQLERDVTTLSNQILTLNTQIQDTKKQLSSSQGDNAFLQRELNRLMAEKSELERRFNDMALLKDQVRKLKEDMDVSRRLEAMREGQYGLQDQKGAQRLMQGALAAGPTRPASTNAYDLNVEVRSDGSVQVIPPISAPPGGGSAPATP